MAGDGSAGGDSAAGGGLATAALRSRFGGWRLGGRRLGGGGGLATAAPRSQLGVYLSFSLSFSLSRGLSVLIRGHIQDLCGQSFMHKNVQSVLALRLNPHPQGLALFSTHAVRSTPPKRCPPEDVERGSSAWWLQLFDSEQLEVSRGSAPRKFPQRSRWGPTPIGG